MDVFTKRASYCKKLAKTAYFLLIIVAAAIVFASVIHVNIKEYLGEEDLRVLIICLSLFASLLASLITYVDPASQWQQLRGAALSLESEIWKYRTRTGQYSMSTKMHGDRGAATIAGAEEALRYEAYLPRVRISTFFPLSFSQALSALFRRLVCEGLKSHVLKSASIASTGFFSRFKIIDSNSADLRLFSHGQYEGCGVQGTFGASNRNGNYNDDHQVRINSVQYSHYYV